MTRRTLLADAARAVTLLIFSPGVQAAKQRAADEYELKAAFLFNIVKFVEWPSEAFAGASAPIVIGVSGADLFGARLDRVVDGQTVNGRPFRVERFPGVADVRGCHIVFVLFLPCPSGKSA